MACLRCLICYSEVTPSSEASTELLKADGLSSAACLSSSSSVQLQRSSPSDQQICADLHTIFTLRNLLEVPQKELTNHLVKWGSPSKWIRCCGRCHQAVKKAKSIHQQILDAERLLKRVKQEIISVVKESSEKSLKTRDGRGENKISEGNDSNDTEGGLENGSSDGQDGILEITNKTREFVERHEYDLLGLEDPFLVGDAQAKELLVIRQVLNDGCMMVDDCQGETCANENEIPVTLVTHNKGISTLPSPPHLPDQSTDVVQDMEVEQVPEVSIPSPSTEIEPQPVSSLDQSQDSHLTGENIVAKTNAAVKIISDENKVNGISSSSVEAVLMAPTTVHQFRNDVSVNDIVNLKDLKSPPSDDVRGEDAASSPISSVHFSPSVEEMKDIPEEVPGTSAVPHDFDEQTESSVKTESNLKREQHLKLQDTDLERKDLLVDTNKVTKVPVTPPETLDQDVLRKNESSSKTESKIHQEVSNKGYLADPLAPVIDSESSKSPQISFSPTNQDMEEKLTTNLPVAPMTMKGIDEVAKLPTIKPTTSIQLSFNIPRFPLIKNTPKETDISLKKEVNSFIIPKVPISTVVAKQIPKVKSTEIITDAQAKAAPNSSTLQNDILSGSLQPPSPNALFNNWKPESTEDNQSSCSPSIPIDPPFSPRITAVNSIAATASSQPENVSIPSQKPLESTNTGQNSSFLDMDLDPFLKDLLGLPPGLKRKSPRAPVTTNINDAHRSAGKYHDANGKIRHLCLCGKSYVSNSKLSRHINQINQQTNPGSGNDVSEYQPKASIRKLADFKKPKLDPMQMVQTPNSTGSNTNTLPKTTLEIPSMSNNTNLHSMPYIPRFRGAGLSLMSNNNYHSGLLKEIAQKNIESPQQSTFPASPATAPQNRPKSRIVARKRLTPISPINPLQTPPTTPSQLRNMRNDKWYSCGQCLTAGAVVRRFASLTSLTTHIHSVHGGWKCTIRGCGKRFETHLALQTHVIQRQCQLQAFRTSEAHILKTAPITISSVKKKPVQIDDINDILEVNLVEEINLAEENDDDNDDDVVCIHLDD